MAEPDFVIAGAGIIGLSLALELDRRGAQVVVLERERALGQASTAAAGMLAAEDPANPAALRELSRLSARLYPAFLDRVAELSGMRIPFQTTATLQENKDGDGEANVLDDPTQLVPQLVAGDHRFALLPEFSVDPRQMAEALLAAVRATSIDLRESTPLARLAMHTDGVRLDTGDGTVHASHVVDCMGAWSPAPVSPRKGQMFSVALPPGLPLEMVVRAEKVYIVPRTEGPNAGRAIIGATVEDAGFDVKVHPLDILTLNAHATRLLPALSEAKFIESWAGLRPATADGLPILGATARQPRYVIANGHFRNGILLAPATAHVMAQLLLGEAPAVDLSAFSPERF